MLLILSKKISEILVQVSINYWKIFYLFDSRTSSRRLTKLLSRIDIINQYCKEILRSYLKDL